MPNLDPANRGTYIRRSNLSSADTMLAMVANEAPRVPFDVFVRQIGWRQGEHVGLIGPTGQGKTTFLVNLLRLRRYVTVFATKPYDETMDYLISQGYVKFSTWENIDAKRIPRRVLWPDATSLDSEENQERVFKDAMRRIYRERGWTLVVDEGFVLSEVLRAKKEMRTVWTQGRSLGISFVVATQRPAWVPREMYDQSTHLLFWRENDPDNLSKISGIAGRDPRLVRHIVSNLEQYQVLYANTRTGTMLRTRAPRPDFQT